MKNDEVIDLMEYKLNHGLNGDEISFESQGMAVILKFPNQEKAISGEAAAESVSSVLKFQLRNRMQEK